MSDRRHVLIRKLEEHFRRITLLLYDTSVPPQRVDEEVTPHLDANVSDVKFLIQAHEEMWSFGDMIEAIPLAGWFYKKIFRPGFSRGFLRASQLVCRARQMLPNFEGS